MNSFKLCVPYPPVSGNHYIGTTKTGRRFVTAKATEYRALIKSIINKPPRLAGPVAVRLDTWTPDNRKRDLDNIEKVLFDALTLAGLWIDDSQIIDKHHVRHGKDKPGRIEIDVQNQAEAPPPPDPHPPRPGGEGVPSNFSYFFKEVSDE